VFLFVIWSTFVFFFLFQKLSTTTFLSTYTTVVGYMSGYFLVYIHCPYFEDPKSREKPTGNFPV
jgi:asparagine N-glycosylation enzyme membrane subunit Stt3